MNGRFRLSLIGSRAACGILALTLAVGYLPAAEPSAAQIAKLAREAEKTGLIVRAWELYREAARLDPANMSYRARRDSLEKNARLLSQFGVQTEDKSLDDLKKDAAAEPAAPDTPDLEAGALELPTLDPFVPAINLLPPPKLTHFEGVHSFDSRSDEKGLYAIVAKAFGFKVIFDPAFDSKPNLQFRVDNVDLRDALEALTAATNTFLFPVTTDTIFVARDDQAKRQKFEPEVALTVPLPDAVDPKDVAEATTAVKGLLQSQRIMQDDTARTIVIRDRISRAYIARALFESLLLPKPQVSLGFKFLELDESVSYHYGIAFPTSYPVINFGHLNHFQSIITVPEGFTGFLAFGGGATLFGVGIADTNLFAISSKSWTHSLFEGSLIAGNGQPTTLHVGDKYPIAQALSTGYSQGGGAQVVPQTTQEDLGISIKATPHIFSSDDVVLDLEISYKTLGTLVLNTVPEINIREYKGSVHLTAGESAVIAGIDSETLTTTRNGIMGLADIPWVNQFLAENTRDKEVSRTLVLLNPVVTRAPAYERVIPAISSGGENGERVLL